MDTTTITVYTAGTMSGCGLSVMIVFALLLWIALHDGRPETPEE